MVVLTSFGADARIFEAIDAGARGFMLKDADTKELVRAIRAAHAGDSPLDPRAARAVITRRTVAAPWRDLSDREREVLRLVADGLPTKVIARRMGITDATVRAHLTSIYRTIGVTDRTRAALWASRRGLQRS